MNIYVELRYVVKSDEACLALGLNPYCVNGGADGKELIKVELKKAQEWGILNND